VEHQIGGSGERCYSGTRLSLSLKTSSGRRRLRSDEVVQVRRPTERWGGGTFRRRRAVQELGGYEVWSAEAVCVDRANAAQLLSTLVDWG
jgi:hypothetical protein